MINRIHRFHGHNSLRYVYQNGQVTRGPLFSVKYILNNRREVYRVAVVVSKKVHKSAVKRNRIRRRLYEQIRLIESKINKPYDIVINVFSDQLATLPIDDLTNQLRSQLSHARIISTKPTPVRDKINTEGE